ncbi:MAG TPA: hypothetical protein DF613_15230 [Lachnospiraceae bacterium]|nr:hypothetical protein [Lachnospiraceae bacterium]
MNARERFIEVMKYHNPDVRSLKWEFGYWGNTLNRWYREGLPRKNWAPIPDKITSVNSSLYTYTWNAENKHVKPGDYPGGYVSMAGGLYWPTQGFALDQDVKNYFHMDETQQLIDLNLLAYPLFEPHTVYEDDDKLQYVDIDGVERLFSKKEATLACTWKVPVTDWESWTKYKEERLSLKNIRQRLPENWEEKVKEYKNRTYPLGMGGYPLGFFGTLAQLLGYDNLFLLYYDEPEMIHDMMDTFTSLWIALFDEVLKDVEVDHVQIWEDISFGLGCMISMDTMREFMLPYYRRLTRFLKERGVDIICVDTDGKCYDIIPFFMEAGVTAMLPFEVHCGMDVVKVREMFPDLAIMGGIPKSSIPRGKAAIDAFLEPVKKVLRTGGYIPFGDHFIPPEVPFEDFSYYRNRLNELIDSCGVR